MARSEHNHTSPYYIFRAVDPSPIMYPRNTKLLTFKAFSMLYLRHTTNADILSNENNAPLNSMGLELLNQKREVGPGSWLSVCPCRS